MGVNFDKTPVILILTSLETSPFSYPKKYSLVLILSFIAIAFWIPLHPKNWFTDFDVYVIVLSPLMIVPESGKPIVESTVITEDPMDTALITLVSAWILKDPSIKSLSSNPINKPSL